MVKNSLKIFLLIVGLLGSTLSRKFPIQSYTIIVFLAGLLLVFYLSTLINLKRSDSKLIVPTTLSTLYILFLSWSAIGCFYSADPEKSLYITILSLSTILLYLGLTLHIKSLIQVENILKILICFGGMLALVGIFQQFPLAILKNLTQNTGNNSTSIFIHKNIFSGYLLLLIPLACFIFLDSFSRFWKIISGSTFILFLTALIFTGSRGGQLVGIFSLFIITGYLILNNELKIAKILVLGVLISIVLYFIIDPIAKTLQMNNSAFIDSRASLIDLAEPKHWRGQQWFNRILFWQGGWEIFKDHWFLGSGPNTFELLFPKYYLNFNPVIEKQILTSGAPPHAHNIFVQTASDSGAVGIGLILAFCVVFYMRAYNLFRRQSQEKRSIIFFFGLSVTCFLFHNLVEYNWYGPIFIYQFTFFIFVIDFIWRQKFKKKTNNPSNRSILTPLITGVIVVPLTLMLSIQYYKFNTIFYEDIFYTINPKKLSSLVLRIQQYCPRCDRPHMQMALNILQSYKIYSNEENLALAKKELLKGQKLNPYNPEYKGYLAQIYSVQGEHVRALPLLKEALIYSKTHYIKNFGLGAALSNGK